MDTPEDREEPVRRLPRRLPHVRRRAAHGEGSRPATTSLHWSFEANLAQDSSHATIYNLPRGGALVAYESLSGCPRGDGQLPRAEVLRDRVRAAERRREPQRRAAAHAVELRGGNAQHHLRDLDPVEHPAQLPLLQRTATSTARRAGRCRASTPRGWSASTAPSIDAGILAAGASPDGSIGDRDAGFYDGASQRLYEAQLVAGDFGSWRNFLWVGAGGHPARDPHARRLAVVRQPDLHRADAAERRSPAWSSPSSSPLSGAAPGEAGELVYYRPRDPAASAARPTRRSRPRATSRARRTRRATTTRRRACWSRTPPTRVLTLGDNQYETGELANFQTYYAPDWGRLKSITMPTPGQPRPALVGLRPVLRRCPPTTRSTSARGT